MKKVPLRRCLGCLESKPKNELYRIIKTKENEILLDETGKLNGRGAYICKNGECLDKAIKFKRIEREFEIKVTDEIYTKIKNRIEID